MIANTSAEETPIVRSKVENTPMAFSSLSRDNLVWFYDYDFRGNIQGSIPLDFQAEINVITKAIHGDNSKVRIYGIGKDRLRANSPFGLVSGPIEGSRSSEVMKFVNTARLNELPNNIESIAPSFELIDLFGAVPDDRLYELLSKLDSNGTLILPYGGVDFERIPNLPRSVKKLVVYNSDVSLLVSKLVDAFVGLDELVLWGCWSSERVVLSEKLIENLMRLRVFWGDSKLLILLSAVEWKELYELSLNFEDLGAFTRPFHNGRYSSMWKRLQIYIDPIRKNREENLIIRSAESLGSTLLEKSGNKDKMLELFVIEKQAD